MDDAVIVMFEDVETGCRRGFRVRGPEIIDPDAPDHVLVLVEWWGGDTDGDAGIIRLTHGDAAWLRAS